MTYISLSVADLAVGSLLIVANGALSLMLGLKIERTLLVATLRMIVQLTLVGYILTVVFDLSSPVWTGLIAVVMIVFAGYEVAARQDRRLTGFWSYGLGAAAMSFSSALVTVLALTTQIGPDPWYDPQYAIPLLGMILGNSMTGIALSLSTLTTGVARDRAAIEAQLCLGATRWVACGPLARSAIRTGLMPMINAMAAAGVVSLPGMMTGQILAGVPPTEAVRYQILIMFLIVGATGLGVLITVFGGLFYLTDARHRLRLDRLRQARLR
ncbi:MAG: iron export ABC transporter permease subunit FetB [Rhodospirillaceae bacterium]